MVALQNDEDIYQFYKCEVIIPSRVTLGATSATKIPLLSRVHCAGAALV